MRCFTKPADGCGDLIEAPGIREGNEAERARKRKDMAVWVEKRGQECFPLQIDALRFGCQRFRVHEAARRGNAPAADQHRLTGGILHRDDIAAVKYCFCHAKAPFAN